MNLREIKGFLDEKVRQYEHPRFIETDPIAIPHEFSKKEDIEISSFLIATIAWGNRKMILNSGRRMMELLDHCPYDFVMNHSNKELESLSSFVHRTFQGVDLITFIKGLQHIYKVHKGLEASLKPRSMETNYKNAISSFKQKFFSIEHPYRSEKHISDPHRNSAAKRIHMYLRWMVRNPINGVDFGIWQSHKAANLSCPLDVHSGRVARKLGLLDRKQNDWKAVTELDTRLRKMDKNDPVKYDFALFGLGVFEKF